MNYKELNAEELNIVYDQVARELSYFNSAESSWSAETKDRNACRAVYQEICKEYKERGLELPEGNYLI